MALSEEIREQYTRMAELIKSDEPSDEIEAIFSDSLEKMRDIFDESEELTGNLSAQLKSTRGKIHALVAFLRDGLSLFSESMPYPNETIVRLNALFKSHFPDNITDNITPDLIFATSAKSNGAKDDAGFDEGAISKIVDGVTEYICNHFQSGLNISVERTRMELMMPIKRMIGRLSNPEIFPHKEMENALGEMKVDCLEVLGFAVLQNLVERNFITRAHYEQCERDFYDIYKETHFEAGLKMWGS